MRTLCATGGLQKNHAVDTKQSLRRPSLLQRSPIQPGHEEAAPKLRSRSGCGDVGTEAVTNLMFCRSTHPQLRSARTSGRLPLHEIRYLSTFYCMVWLEADIARTPML